MPDTWGKKQMSKVDTLLKLIDHQKQHPLASEAEIAKATGISQRHIRRCQKEVNLLKQQLVESILEADGIAFLISQLNRRDPYHRRIIHQLQKQLGNSYTGCLRMGYKGEPKSYGWLTVGELIPPETKPLGQMPPSLSFWLQNLCYDPLLMCDLNGEISPRLATACEPVNGFSQWQITLREDLRWSDGKPMTQEEVRRAFSKSNIAPIIKEIKNESMTQLRILLSKDEPLFPVRLRSVFVLPSHSTHPYRVISGPYQLKRFRPEALTFRFEINPNYYQERGTNIDWLTLTRFTRPANAIKAVESGKLDLLPLHALQPFYQVESEISPQQCPFLGDNYHLLFLNRHRGLFSDESNCRRLSEAIDYQTIALYLKMGQTSSDDQRPPLSRSTLDLRIACAGGTSRPLAYLIGKSVKSSVINPISIEGELREEADAFVTQIFFGIGYNRLSRFFRSDGKTNFFGYAKREVDDLLNTLDQTAGMVKRQVIGRRVISLLEADFAIIRLHPCFRYFLSPLEIQFNDRLTGIADLIQNLSDIIVEHNLSHSDFR